MPEPFNISQASLSLPGQKYKAKIPLEVNKDEVFLFNNKVETYDGAISVGDDIEYKNAKTGENYSAKIISKKETGKDGSYQGSGFVTYRFSNGKELTIDAKKAANMDTIATVERDDLLQGTSVGKFGNLTTKNKNTSAPSGLMNTEAYKEIRANYIKATLAPNVEVTEYKESVTTAPQRVMANVTTGRTATTSKEYKAPPVDQAKKAERLKKEKEIAADSKLTGPQKAAKIALLQLDSGNCWDNGGFKEYTKGKDENWCSHFATNMYEKAGIKTFFGHEESTLRLEAKAKKNHSYLPFKKKGNYKIQPGDILLMKRDAEGYGHAAIVVEVTPDGKIRTVEGNAGDDEHGDDRFIKSRYYNAQTGNDDDETHTIAGVIKMNKPQRG